MEDKRFEELLSLYLEQEISPEDLKVFVSLLKENPAYRNTLQSEIRAQVLMREVAVEELNLEKEKVKAVRPDRNRVIAQGSVKKSDHDRRQPGAWQWRTLGAIAACIAIIAGVHFYNLQQEKDTTGLIRAKLLEFTPDVYIQRDGARVDPEKAFNILLNDEIRTEKGRAVFKYEKEDTFITLRTATSLTLQERKNIKSIELKKGSVECNVAPQGKDRSFRVRSPHGMAEVMGTHFVYSIYEDHSRIEVSEGTVKLTRSADNASIEVPAGSCAAAGKGRDLAPLPFEKIPAFPGAEGFGGRSRGGRGGKVYPVTNLSNDGPGSLRAAVEASGPRIVIFRVSGTIALQSVLTISNPFITIAGQTAPGDGICLKNYELAIESSDVIIRYIRCRAGDNSGTEAGAIDIKGGRDIIVDHCSASWAVDETVSCSSQGQLDNVTVQWCFITESLNNSVHKKGRHGWGSLINGSRGAKYSFHHNLYAHHAGRTPSVGNYIEDDNDGLVFDFRNNVVYNWGGSVLSYNEGNEGKAQINFINNYYKGGPGSPRSGNTTYGRIRYATSVRSSAYLGGNCMNGVNREDQWSLVKFAKNLTAEQREAFKLSSPVQTASIHTDDAITAYDRVLASAGAALPKRDMVDIRIVQEVTNGEGRIIDDEDEVGGWPELRSASVPDDTDSDGMPDAWENAHGLDPKSNDSAVYMKSGYTAIEEYLNGLELKK